MRAWLRRVAAVVVAGAMLAPDGGTAHAQASISLSACKKIITSAAAHRAPRPRAPRRVDAAGAVQGCHTHVEVHDHWDPGHAVPSHTGAGGNSRHRSLSDPVPIADSAVDGTCSMKYGHTEVAQYGPVQGRDLDG